MLSCDSAHRGGPSQLDPVCFLESGPIFIPPIRVPLALPDSPLPPVKVFPPPRVSKKYTKNNDGDYVVRQEYKFRTEEGEVQC